jgi:hypothetical protein
MSCVPSGGFSVNRTEIAVHVHLGVPSQEIPPDIYAFLMLR